MTAFRYMIKAFFLTSLIIFIFINKGITQISVNVLDSQSGIPLYGATIQIIDQEEIYITDQTGVSQIDLPPPLKLKISFVGYETRTMNIEDGSNVFTVLLEPEKRILNEIMVTGYEDNRKIIDVPGAIHKLTPEDLQRFDQTSIVRGINNIPGVRMEERSPGSYRISIRGSSLRSPFDVRNVKIYWNGIPFTDPNGITPLNLLDINQMQNIEVVKGPAASIYGAGMGGVINLNTEKAAYGKSVSASSSFGSYQMRRYSAAYESGSDHSNYRFIYSKQTTDGYREHTAFDRNTFQLNGEVYQTEKLTLSGNIFYSDLFYQVPGGLTLEQYQDNRRQARPGTAFVPGSVQQNASVNYQAFLTSMKSHYVWSPHLENTTAIYGIQSFFKMPFLLDFERETRLGMGGRTSFKSRFDLGMTQVEMVAGGEYQQMFLEGRNFGNNGGLPDSLRFDDEVIARQGMAFFKTDVFLTNFINISAGLSLNLLEYDIYRLVGLNNEEPGRIIRSFNPVWTPRLGIVVKLNRNISAHGSFGTGFSPPTVKEIRTSDGVINSDLAPESGRNFEVGIRGTSLNQRLNFDLTGFNFKLKETIVTYTDDLFATQKFRNSGTTNQWGMEMTGFYDLIQNTTGFIQNLRFSGSYAYHHFRFGNYLHLDQDFSGNQLTGVAPHVATGSIDLTTSRGLYGYFSWHYTDGIPLNDANTVYSSSYHLADIKLGWQNSFQKMTFDVHIGMNNMLNEKYSLGNDLNPFGERYFQPAAERNIFTGVRVIYALSDNTR